MIHFSVFIKCLITPLCVATSRQAMGAPSNVYTVEQIGRQLYYMYTHIIYNIQDRSGYFFALSPIFPREQYLYNIQLMVQSAGINSIEFPSPRRCSPIEDIIE